ncbi:Uncharacterised protein [Vibrio cholerae]|nr:Uncharacterised protein [Vibrio cholerae]
MVRAIQNQNPFRTATAKQLAHAGNKQDKGRDH